jgi:REP element-mobilizing transposase RayT
MYSSPLAYFLPWHTYATWLPGDPRGSVDADHNAYGDPFAPADAERAAASGDRAHGRMEFDPAHRVAVQATIAEVCRYRKWQLLALHVRRTHVHAVVVADASPEKVLIDFKAYATRRLRREGLVGSADRVWSTHGSTKYIWDRDHLRNVARYVIERQGARLDPAPVDHRAEAGL